jgi:uncharacterized protein (TIGR02246 family)
LGLITLGSLMTRKLLGYVCITGTLLFIAALAGAQSGEEAAVRRLIEERRLAWNAQDTQRYAALLAVDADIVSATGRSAQGREEVIKLYLEQRAGAYRTASITSTVVKRIKFVRPDIAVADAEVELEGARGMDGNVVPPAKTLVFFIVTKEGDQWLISSIRGAPISTIQSSKR